MSTYTATNEHTHKERSELNTDTTKTKQNKQNSFTMIYTIAFLSNVPVVRVMLLFVVREHNGMSQRTFSTTPMQCTTVCWAHYVCRCRRRYRRAVATRGLVSAVSSVCIKPTMLSVMSNNKRNTGRTHCPYFECVHSTSNAMHIYTQNHTHTR